MDENKKEEIKRIILTELYRAWASDDLVSLNPLQEAHRWDEKHFWTAINELVNKHFISDYASPAIYEIQARGILNCEKRGLVPIEQINQNTLIRTLILN